MDEADAANEQLKTDGACVSEAPLGLSQRDTADACTVGRAHALQTHFHAAFDQVFVG